jgi:hypothetical protein
MNYIELINDFWELDETWQFTCCETRLYFYLLKTANRLGWVDSWTHSDAKTAANVGVSVNSFKSARNRLVQAGLIFFQNGGKGQGDKCRYQIRCQNLTPKPQPKPQPKHEPKPDYTLLGTIKTKTKTNIPPTPHPGGEGVDESFSPEVKIQEKEKSCAKKEKESGSGFEEVWALYGKKGNRKTSERKWANLKNHCREAVLKHIPLYVQSTPDKQYRKNFETYINQEAWNDEIIFKTNSSGAKKINSRISVGRQEYGESTI